MQKKIVITGFGGQGVVLAGRILGKAAAIGDGLESTLVQSYGPESRGGACSAQVTIADGPIHYPYIQHPDILVAMSQAGYDKYRERLNPEGILIVDPDLVQPVPGAGGFSIPSTRFAEEMGLKMIANIIMVGFITAITGAVGLESARETVLASVPKGTEEKNLKAFEKGWEYGRSTLKARARKAAGQIGVFA
ncbi:2-oxoglutarate synthase subunit KorC [Desulfosarcina cetonica]|uniref:2-oxoacid:acceptor oxidoreductase family protein n=1 Tax=Desulfosarcina cetonica TaxID=90730 RepID=UPI0006CF2CEE|nr:2-oxoacid:acceptor oxidoreductase family protein [Desulfosarcina cetonica]VTR65467.1 2-oxoglutarate synthase subunit KorC [Desulfosarcina cetonica]